MKKTICILTCIVVMVTLFVTQVSAAAPQWTYECAKLVYPVTVDGVISSGEWDDANAITVNNDDPIFKQFGYWQGGAEAQLPPSDLSCTYKLKWDSEYLYIFEQRLDKKYFNPGATDALAPWNGDGTLFMMAYVNDADWDKGSSIALDYEAFWVTKSGSSGDGGQTFVATRTWDADQATKVQDNTDSIAGWKYAGAKDGDVYTIEIAIPWATFAKYSAGAKGEEGAKYRVTPIVANINGADGYGAFAAGDWNQMNYYCLENEEKGATKDDGMDWGGFAEYSRNHGGMVLTGAIVKPAAEEETPAPAAPQTGDNMVLYAAGLLLFACAAVVTRKLVKR